jgi:hypothetical protein
VGYYIVFFALRENRWAASIIEVRPGQSVISTGPDGIVRHPRYSGGVLMILATPLTLGSLWAFVCTVLLAASSRRGSSTRSGFSRGICQYKAGLPHQGWLTPLDELGSCVHIRRVNNPKHPFGRT